MSDKWEWKIDLRMREIQMREVRYGNAMLFQSRTIIHNLDGSRIEPEWRTTGTCPNYGDCFDKKPKTIMDKIMDKIMGNQNDIRKH